MLSVCEQEIVRLPGLSGFARRGHFWKIIASHTCANLSCVFQLMSVVQQPYTRYLHMFCFV